jgi:hypothetical protein
MTSARARRIASQRYMFDVAKRIDRVLDLTGREPGPLAKLFCFNFVGMAKQAGRSREEATKLFHEAWERFNAAELTPDIDAEVKFDG